MLNLKFQYFGYLMWRANSLKKTLMLGKMEGKRKRGWDGWMSSRTRWTGVWASSRDGEGQGTLPGAVHRSAKSPTGLNKLTTTHSSILAWDPMDTGAWQATVPGDLKELWLSTATILSFSLILMLIQVTSIPENNLLKWSLCSQFTTTLIKNRKGQ